MIKVVEVTDSSKQKTFRGHDAPVLSLSFDPRDVYLVKTLSCLLSTLNLLFRGKENKYILFTKKNSDWAYGTTSFQLTLLMMECVTTCCLPGKLKSLLYYSITVYVLLEFNADLILEGKRWLTKEM